MLDKAESLLHSLASAASMVGLYCNESKTEFITTSVSPTNMKACSGVTLKSVDDYLGSHIMDSAKDLKIRKALAWTARSELNKIWSSNLIDKDTKSISSKQLSGLSYLLGPRLGH